MSLTCEEIAYAESQRAIVTQAGAVDELRSRTGVLLSASAIVASFLGAETLRSGLGFLNVLGIIAFVAVLGASLWILTPRREGWTFVVSATILLEDWADRNRSSTEMQRFIAEKLEEYYDENKARLEDLYAAFQVAIVAIGVEVLAWTIQLGRG